MNKRDKNRLRNRVQDNLTPDETQEARLAWQHAWHSRRDDVLRRDVERARLAMLAALDSGQSAAEAGKIAALELARAV